MLSLCRNKTEQGSVTLLPYRFLPGLQFCLIEIEKIARVVWISVDAILDLLGVIKDMPDDPADEETRRPTQTSTRTFQ
jgi:hypothetical protein